YGKDYYPGEPRVFKTKSGAQDAHEAIRPSDVTLTPESIKGSLTSEQFRLYRLIWSRFVACQMSGAVYDSVTIDVTAADYIFRANHASLKFSGFTAVYEEGKDEEEEKPQSPLPDLTEGEHLTMNSLNKEQHFTTPPARYTEATLIRALEEKGVGRPSTYAPTVSTIIDREYVIKEGKYLRTTPLGEVVTGLMKDKFADIVDPAFTAHMEENLDKVEAGKENWKSVLGNFYKGFSENLQKVESEMDGERIKVPDELSDEVCDLCGKQLVIKSGRFGRFLACPGYPECTFTKPIVIEMPGRCPKCGSRILKKTSRNGYTYYGCEHNGGKNNGAPCDFMTWDVPVKDDCPECGMTMFKKSGRGAKKPYCVNEECPNFTPEDKRGGYKKKVATTAEGETPAEDAKKTAKKPATKKAAAKKPAAKKPAAKKPAAKKAVAKKPAAKKPAAKKASAKKPTT
ncbi:MAG: DNA topoisomerase, partial [Oscillospiraceae bacterium]